MARTVAGGTRVKRARLRSAALWVGAVALFAAVGLSATFWIDGALGRLDQPRIEERVRAAAVAGAGIGTWFGDAKADVAAMAAAIQPWSGNPGQLSAARRTLDRMLETAPRFDNGAIVLDTNKRVIAASTSEAPLVGLVRDSSFARAAMKGAVSVSGVVEDPLERIPVVAFAAPLKDAGGKVTAALVATTRVAGPLAQVVKRYQTDPSLFEKTPGVQLLLVAPDGTALAAEARDPLQREVAEASSPAGQARADSNPGFIAYEGEAKVPKVAGYAQVSNDWVVLVTQDARDFYGFGTSFGERLRFAGPTRTAAIAFGLTLTLALLALATLYRRLVNAEARSEDTKRAFLAITGHELRTPLTSIRGFTQLLNSRWEAVPEKQKRELVQTIARQARSLEHLIERLIVGSQLEAGIGPAPTIRPIDAADAVAQAAEQYGAMTKLHTIEADVARPMMVEADGKVLQDVVGHLLENAIKYSPSGGTVWVKGRRHGGRVEIIVEDEGVGLPSDISGIFDKFVQAEATDTRTHDEGGVGLGLYIVKTYLERMNGAVRAERREPAGARFVVTLRAAR